MQNVLLVVQLILAVALVAVVLVQRTAQDGGGLTGGGGGGGTMGGLFTARGSANILTRITAVLATCFIVNSLALGIMASHRGEKKSLVDQIEVVAETQGDAKDAPKADEAKGAKDQTDKPAKDKPLQKTSGEDAKPAKPAAKSEPVSAPEVPLAQ